MAQKKRSSSKKNSQEIPISIKPQRNSLFTTITIIVFLLLVVSLISGCTSLLLPDKQTGNVALVPVHGVVVPSTDSFDATSISSSQIIDLLESADNDPMVQAIVLDINSGGGAPVASAEVAQTVKNLDKPTIAWIRDTGASGAYWIASASDTIVAHKLSTTGSIGVHGSYLEFSGLLSDYNVTYNRQVSGYYKDMGSPYREMSPSEERIYQDLLDKMHDVFIEEVATNRNMSVQRVSELSDGRIYLGLEAVENGLVDTLGSRAEVLELASKHTGGETVEFKRYSPQQSFFSMMPGLSSSLGHSIGSGLGKELKTDNSAKPRT